MIGFMIPYIVGLLMLLGGGDQHTDLLDVITTGDYWQLKHVTPELAQLQRDVGTDPAPASIAEQVRNLASADFATRDKARRELENMGPAILGLLEPVAKSPDPEVASVAEDLIKKFTQHGQERAIRRLMAIRTLGERKEKAALAQLEQLKNSPDVFIASYARRAIAQINGTPLPVDDMTAKMELDRNLLPADAALAGQTRGLALERFTIASLVEKAIASDPRANLPMPADMPPQPKPDAKQITMQASEQVLSVVERVGDIRLDAVTLGFNIWEDEKAVAPRPAVMPAEPVATTQGAASLPAAGREEVVPDDFVLERESREHGWVVVIFRGQFNRDLALKEFGELVGSDAEITPAKAPGDIARIADKDGEAVALLPNDQQILLITGPNAKEVKATAEKMTAALKAGKGTLGENKELAALMKTVDLKAPLWMVSKFTPLMTKELFSGQIQTLTAEIKPGEKGMNFTFNAQAGDAEKAKDLVTSMGDDLKSQAVELKQMVASRPPFQAVLDMYTSINLKNEGDHAVMSGTIPAGLLNAFFSEMPIMELIGIGRMVPPVGAIDIPPDMPVEQPIQPLQPAGPPIPGNAQDLPLRVDPQGPQ